ncbi:uracil-DNA glycosylase-like protein [Lipomyces kononenkoae]|uniref:Uracil-DNA glycosylase-like protein n=1 Tax=Lipomyces kononenkoae TaxID=34357 RepID=A0ACC3T8V9_LIPKO
MSATIAKRKASAPVLRSDAVKKTRPLTAFFSPKSVAISTELTKAAVSKGITADGGKKESEVPCVLESVTRELKLPGETVLFDKQKWIDSLVPEHRDLLQLEISTMHESWLAVLSSELTKPYFLSLKRFLVQEHRSNQKILPLAPDVYSWSRLTPLDKVKVVVIGQDPYHGLNQAHGLAFSVMPPTAAPPSLRNIFIALKKDYPDFEIPSSGLLTKWAEQGVLLLNTCLTVRAHNANSHAGKGWEQFTEKVISIVAERQKSGVVFLAWGNPAGKRVDKINKSVHAVLRSVHPSPLSASRGFFDCGHFQKTNQWLKERYGDDALIDWML